MDAFVAMVSNLGIPMACLAVVFYLWREETMSHKAEEEKNVSMQMDFCKALESNTAAINALCEKINDLR